MSRRGPRAGKTPSVCAAPILREGLAAATRRARVWLPARPQPRTRSDQRPVGSTQCPCHAARQNESLRAYELFGNMEDCTCPTTDVALLDVEDHVSQIDPTPMRS